MAQKSDFVRGYWIVTRWRNLAEKRLAYLHELYESGRWQRFHSEQAFVDNIRDAKLAVEAWRLLAPRVEDCGGDTTAARWLSRQPFENVTPLAALQNSSDSKTSDSKTSDRKTATQLPPPSLPDRVGPDHHLGKS